MECSVGARAPMRFAVEFELGKPRVEINVQNVALSGPNQKHACAQPGSGWSAKSGSRHSAGKTSIGGSSSALSNNISLSYFIIAMRSSFRRDSRACKPEPAE